MNYKFTKNWFNDSGIKKEIQKFIISENINKILEIGSFEGQSSVFFSDNLLNNKNSFLVCVDPFFDSGTVNGITTLYVNKDVKNRFLNNISKSKNFNKITHECTTSDNFFLENKIRFNFIYIDGCHNPEYVKRDVNNSFKILEKNGILWMDDYLYGHRKEHNGRPKDVIDQFLKDNNGKYEIIHKGYQIAIRKLC
jgi:predicted O-methyltransferase YrrM